MSATAFREHGSSPVSRQQLPRQQLLDLARAAHQAPSIHNSQPWQLRASDTGLDLYEDVSRSLPGTDPRGRDRLISCGAALRNAEIAMARLGHVPVTTLFPDGPDAPLLAALRAGAPRRPSTEVERLYRAIPTRRTHRRIYMASHTRNDLLPKFAAAVAPFGARLAVLAPGRRERFARIVWSAAQQQARDDEKRRELQEWTRPGRSGDGIPAGSQGSAPFPVDGLLTRPPAPTEAPPPWVQEDLANGTIAVLLVRRDGRTEWLQAGRALETLLLTLTAEGLVASFLNQPVEQEQFRPELAAVVGEVGAPQVVLRIGEPLVGVPRTPRRPLADVLAD
jgi:nitroreductase